MPYYQWFWRNKRHFLILTISLTRYVSYVNGVYVNLSNLCFFLSEHNKDPTRLKNVLAKTSMCSSKQKNLDNNIHDEIGFLVGKPITSCDISNLIIHWNRFHYTIKSPVGWLVHVLDYFLKRRFVKQSTKQYYSTV